MIYRQRNNKTSNKKKYIIVAIFLLVLILGGGFVKGMFQGLAFPVLNLSANVSAPVSNLFSYFQSKNQLEKTNEELLNENRNLKIEILTVEALKQENEDLKRTLNFIEVNPNIITAKIISKPPHSPYDTFVINSNEKIAVGQNVYYKKLLVGKVYEVYEKTAIIKLSSSSGEKVPVQVLGNEYEAEGQGNLSFKIKVPKSILIEDNTPIYAAHDQSVLGLVQSVNAGEASAFQDVYFRYPININELDYVEIHI